MSKKNKNISTKKLSILDKNQDGIGKDSSKHIKQNKGFWKRFAGVEKIGIIGLSLLLVVGVMGSGLGQSIINNLTGNSNTNSATNKSKSKGSKNNLKSEESIFSKLNPFAEPMPSNTPQLAKEYVYAGSRLLAVEDAGATSSPTADLAIWRPSTGEWWVTTSSSHITYPWGVSTDTPVPGDYDGDGKADFCVYREVTGASSMWYIVNSSDGSTGAVPFGSGDANDIPVPADYDGDGKTDWAVYRPAEGKWYIYRSGDGGTTIQPFGISTDLPSVADYDGDGKADISLWRNGDNKFHTLQSSDGTYGIANFSNSSTQPVSADYDGDGKADFAIRDGINWIILESTTIQFITIPWQNAGDIAVPKDYDGDGRTDIAVWHGEPTSKGDPDVGKWFIRKSTDSTLMVETWGVEGDIPIPALYKR